MSVLNIFVGVSSQRERDMPNSFFLNIPRHLYNNIATINGHVWIITCWYSLCVRNIFLQNCFCKIYYAKFVFLSWKYFCSIFFLLYEELYRHFFSKRERVGRTMSSSTHNTSKHMDDDALTAQIWRNAVCLLPTDDSVVITLFFASTREPMASNKRLLYTRT